MLYTIMPLERIYADPGRDANRKKQRQEEDENCEFHEVILPHGRIVAKREKENYIVEKIISTDMHDYLNEEYTPGNIIQWERQEHQTELLQELQPELRLPQHRQP